MNSLRHFPLGEAYPASPHAVASSLPTLLDVCAYEEKDARVVEALKSGYPRFVVHEYVRRLWNAFQEKFDWGNRHGVLIPSRRAAHDLVEWFGGALEVAEVDRDLYAVHCGIGDEELFHRLAKYVQHVGCGVSSRHAEDILLQRGLIDQVFFENTFVGNAEQYVEKQLAELCGCRTLDVLLCSCGMSAFYAGFRAVQEFQLNRGRTHWVQLGWLYLDSGCILTQFLTDGEQLETVFDATDLDQLFEKLDSLGSRLSGVVVECPTNPLVQVADLERVAGKVHSLGGLMIVDPTMASVYNVDVLTHADILVTSLTKYAANEGDVMMGALVVNPDSEHYADLVLRTSRYHVPPYRRDLARLAHEMTFAGEVIQQINDNARHLAEWLKHHPRVSNVHFAENTNAYDLVKTDGGGGGSIITIELKKGFEVFYDSVRLLKGPSFGTQFTFLSCFMYLAHYDLVTTRQGREYLQAVGINPELIRISVGAEPYEEIQAVFEQALAD